VLRDSRDRAQAIKSQEDAQLSLQLAKQAGDKFMVKAIAQLAVTKGWTSVVDAYTADNSHARSMLDELAAIPSGPRTNTADAAAFSVQVPKELSAFTGVNAGSLERLAAGETQHYLTNSDGEMEMALNLMNQRNPCGKDWDAWRPGPWVARDPVLAHRVPTLLPLHRVITRTEPVGLVTFPSQHTFGEGLHLRARERPGLGGVGYPPLNPKGGPPSFGRLPELPGTQGTPTTKDTHSDAAT